MGTIRILLSRFAALFRSQSLDEELDEELHTHIEFAIEDNIQRGMTEREARTAALRKFGGQTQAKEAYRVQRGLPYIEQAGRDLRYGFRQLRRSPGFAMTAILTLALGLGANTAIFSLINALLLRPLPVPRADELVLVYASRLDNQRGGFSLPLFRALEKRHEVFRDVAAFIARPMEVRGSSGIVEIPGAMVSGQFFRALETPPLLGRYLTAEDDCESGGAAGFGVVISEGFWQTWFNSARDVVGSKLTIANAPFTVVGVMPKRFVWAEPTERADIYVPGWAEPVIDAPYNNSSYHSTWLRVLARRNPGVSLDQANAALRAESNSILEEAIPDAKWIADARSDHFQLVAESGSNGLSLLRWSFGKPLIVVSSLCGAMLLLTCLNLASLLMARAATRQRELATRLAIGASRQRLIQQLLLESLLIALLGAAAGVAAAPVVSRSLAVFLTGRDRFATLDTSLDLRVFLFVAGIALAATVLIGLIPALRATGRNLNDQIKCGSREKSVRERRRFLPRILMGMEVALALTIVIGAGLLATSLMRLYRTGLGFDPEGLVNLDLEMGKQPLDGDALLRWYRAFGDALQHLPGVRSVSFEGNTPLTGSLWQDDSMHSAFSNGNRTIYMNAIAPGYFQTLRIPIFAGREFQWEDTSATEPKIVLSQSAAQRLFPGQYAVGQTVTGYPGQSYRVIAVAGDIHYMSIRKSAAVGAYLPITQLNWHKPSYAAVVRLDGPAIPLAAVRALTARMAPDVPAPLMTTMSGVLDASIGAERMMAMLAVFFAGCALLVTAIGLYGTLAYATARRTSEIGIRMALGAQRRQVVAMVFGENAWIAIGGSMAGLAAAWLASRALASFLYETSAHDPWVLLASAAALAAIASAASLIPALRAARIEPMEALRAE